MIALYKGHLFSFFIVFAISVSAYSEIVFGPETFMSRHGELTITNRAIDLGDSPVGKYLIQIQNGVNGPALVQQCENKSTIELKRQCQFENLVDKSENQITRAEKLFISINGQKIINRTLISKSTSYLEFPIEFTTKVNQLKFEVQGTPEAVVQIKIISIDSPLQPRALFTLNRNHGRAPLKLNFNAAQSFDPLNRSLAYKWFIGAQEISQKNSDSYVFSRPGSYQLKLVVKNSAQQISELMADIVVLTEAQCDEHKNKKPIAKIVVSRPDPLNLRKVQVSSLGSYDPDGFITKTEIDFGDGTKVVSTEAVHEYQIDGAFLVKVKVVDNLNASSTIEKSISVVLSNELTRVGSILGPKKYYGSFKENNSYIENLNILTAQTQDLYKVKIKNADGLEHSITACAGTVAQKIICNYNNWVNRTYIAINRVDWAQVYINNKKITDSASINKNKIYFETYLKLSEINQLKIKLKGWPTAYIDLEIEQLSLQTDRTAPVLTSNVLSDAITNINLVHISVQDNSTVTTQIFKDNILIKTETAKEFDIALTEGLNNFVLKSKDSANNQASDFVISNIKLDTVPAVITTNLKTQYFYRLLPATEGVQIQSSEALKSFEVNQVAKTLDTNFSYSEALQFTAASTIVYHIKAIDLAGNITDFNQSVIVTLDNTPPEIITASVPAIIITNSYLLSFQVNDANSTQTSVQIDDVFYPAVAEKNISYLIDFPVDGTKTIQIHSVDIAGNETLSVVKITKDTSPLRVEFISPQPYGTYPSQNVQVRLRANKLLASATLNTLNVALSADQISFGQNTAVSGEGQYTFVATVTDIYGHTANAKITFEIKTRSIASWEYQECPAQ